MKKISILFSFCLLMFACKNSTKTTQNNFEVKKIINLTIDDWHKAASEANFENYFNVLDSTSIYIGTDASENWSKKDFSAFSKPYFDKGKAWIFTPIERNIYTNKTNEIVWFDELLKTWMGICRGSGVLEKDGENWKIKHYVLSLTIPNDNINEVFNINKVKDSLFLTTINK